MTAADGYRDPVDTHEAAGREKGMEFGNFMRELYDCGALRHSDQVSQGTVEAIQPSFAAEWPRELHPAVRQVLIQQGIHSPYQHQYDAIVKSLAGHDVVLESPTASGKTLAFTSAMVHSLLKYRRGTALMIYPMKALAFDQRTQIREICEPLNIDSWPYHGDVPVGDRAALRTSPPQILLTNPEYLNMSFLAYRDIWDGFLRNLQYVVIDEMHEYRGYFGGNVALLLRRFFLHLRRIGSFPRVFLSTATCDNPGEHARNLTGREVEEVSARNVYRPRRHYLFVNPNIPDYQYRNILRYRVELAALQSLEAGKQILVFCPTKRLLEEAFRNSRRRAEERGLDANRMTAFHADLKGELKQDIQQRIKSGEIRVVFTTNALELGLDIGRLDGVILMGFPSSIMSAWQQIGRAGRSWDKDAFVLLYAMNDPIDRFFVGNIDAFLNKPFDALVVDPENEELIDNHMGALVEETSGELSPADEHILGSAFYQRAKEEDAQPLPGYKPHAHLSLRGSYGKSYQLKRGREEIGQISEMRLFREAYIGAVFTFFGQKYVVHAHEGDAVVLDDADQNRRTEAGFYVNLWRNAVVDGYSYRDVQVYCGVLNISVNFTGYKLINEVSGEVIDSFGGEGRAHYQNNLHGLWMDLPYGAADPLGLAALEHLIRVGTLFILPVDRFDTSTYSTHGPTARDTRTVYYYENYSGGIGIAKKVFEKWPECLKKGMEVAQDCRCRSGCQNCIEPAKSYHSSGGDLDKRLGIELGHRLLSAHRRGPSHRFRRGRLVAI